MYTYAYMLCIYIYIYTCIYIYIYVMYASIYIYIYAQHTYTVIYMHTYEDLSGSPSSRTRVCRTALAEHGPDASRTQAFSITIITSITIIIIIITIIMVTFTRITISIIIMFTIFPELKLHQRGVQWKQGVVIYVMLCTSLSYNTTPIHCTPLPLHPPLRNVDERKPGLPSRVCRTQAEHDAERNAAFGERNAEHKPDRVHRPQNKLYIYIYMYTHIDRERERYTCI